MRSIAGWIGDVLAKPRDTTLQQRAGGWRNCASGSRRRPAS